MCNPGRVRRYPTPYWILNTKEKNVKAPYAARAHEAGLVHKRGVHLLASIRGPSYTSGNRLFLQRRPNV
jgi:hypothetical protein